MYAIKQTRCTGEIYVYSTKYVTMQEAEKSIKALERMDAHTNCKGVYKYEIIENRQ